MRVIVARSNSFIPLKCKKSIHVVFHYRSPETARPSFMEIFAKQCLLDFVWLALPFAGVVAFRRFRLSAAEFAANRRLKVQKRSQLFISTHSVTLSVSAMCVSNPNSSPLLEADEPERPAMSSMARHEN
jgi:hypothetical protein